jgi:hypothetical protein
MPQVQFIHPKTKKVHTIEDNPKFVRTLLARGYKRVKPEVLGENGPELFVPAKPPTRKELFARAKELNLSIAGNASTDALAAAVAEAEAAPAAEAPAEEDSEAGED